MPKNKAVDRRNARIQDVADEFGVTERTVRRWMDTTDIPYRRIERTIRFDLDEVLDWSQRGGDGSEAA